MNRQNRKYAPPILAGAIGTWALWLAVFLPFGSALAGQAEDDKATMATTEGTANVASPGVGETNSVVTQIHSDLEQVKLKINGAVAAMQEAANSSAKQHATAVSNLATEIRELANTQLSDNADMMQKSAALLAKMQDATAKARALSKDPAVKSRDIYAEVLVQLEAEVSQLIDARAMVKDIRRDILAQADRLADEADAIGFAENAHQAIIASTAFRSTLSEVVAFTKRLEVTINQMGNAQSANKA